MMVQKSTSESFEELHNGSEDQHREHSASVIDHNKRYTKNKHDIEVILINSSFLGFIFFVILCFNIENPNSVVKTLLTN